MTLQGAAFLVRVRPSSAATKPKVLAGVSLLEADLPLTLVECGFAEMLQEFEAPPAVWKFMLEHYPGRTTMTAFLGEGDEPSSGESKQGEAGRGPLNPPQKAYWLLKPEGNLMCFHQMHLGRRTGQTRS